MIYQTSRNQPKQFYLFCFVFFFLFSFLLFIYGIPQGFAEIDKKKPPSGLPVPRMVSLKYNKTNARMGPSKKHPVKWVYLRKNLPMMIIAEAEDWRRVRDPSGEESWMHKRVLSHKRSVLFRQEAFLYKKPDPRAKIRARITPGVLFILNTCNDSGWCELTRGNRLSGWTKKKALWGIYPKL